jgi:hypothetical protein
VKEIDDLKIAATWQDVLNVGRYYNAELSKFSLDVFAEVIIGPAAEGFIYELTLNSTTYSYTRQAGQTEADVAAAWITQLKTERLPFYTFDFRAQSDFADTIVIENKEELTLDANTIAVGANLTIDTARSNQYGLRSEMLLETARRCKESVYGPRLRDAQKYLAAHFATQTFVPAAGQGNVSGESFEGESTTWTMPRNNPKAEQEDLLTIFGARFLQIRTTRIVRYRVY